MLSASRTLYGPRVKNQRRAPGFWSLPEPSDLKGKLQREEFFHCSLPGSSCLLALRSGLTSGTTDRRAWQLQFVIIHSFTLHSFIHLRLLASFLFLFFLLRKVLIVSLRSSKHLL